MKKKIFSKIKVNNLIIKIKILTTIIIYNQLHNKVNNNNNNKSLKFQKI